MIWYSFFSCVLILYSMLRVYNVVFFVCVRAGNYNNAQNGCYFSLMREEWLFTALSSSWNYFTYLIAWAYSNSNIYSNKRITMRIKELQKEIVKQRSCTPFVTHTHKHTLADWFIEFGRWGNAQKRHSHIKWACTQNNHINLMLHNTSTEQILILCQS